MRPSRLGIRFGLVVRVAPVFLPAAAVGTVGHELGHWLASRAAGCAPVLHFAWVSPHCPETVDPVARLWSIAAGPLSTMVCGSVGLGLLLRWRKTATHLDWSGTLWTVLALFWSRQIFNVVVHAGTVALGVAGPRSVSNNDEVRLAVALGLPDLSLGLLTALLGLGVCGWAVWTIPPADRVSWAVGAVMGSLLGFALWMASIGPLLLP